jgi:hypothetical protein
MHRPLRHCFPSLFQRQPSITHLLGNFDFGQVQPLLEIRDYSLGFEKQGYVIHRGDVVYAEDLFRSDVTEHGYFVFGGLSQGLGDQQPAGNLQACELKGNGETQT